MSFKNLVHSDNVMNGAYEDVVLKGKSLVNVIQEPSSQDVVLPYAFEDGQYVTINDTKESGALGIELKGQTLVNLWKQIHGDVTVQQKVEGTTIEPYSEQYNRVLFGEEQINPATTVEFKTMYKLKANKTYYINTFVFDFADGDRPLIRDSINGVNLNTVLISGYPPGSILSFETTNETDHIVFYYFANSRKHGSANYGKPFYMPIRFIVSDKLEDVTNKESFEGLSSCKMPLLHTVGRLFDAQHIIPNNTFTYSHSTNTGRFEFTNRGDVVANTNIQLPAGTYDISFLVRGVCDNGRVAIAFAKDGQVWHGCSRVEVNYGQFGSTTFKEVKSQYTFDAPVTVTLVGHAWAGGATGSGWCEFKDIRFTPVGKTSILS